MQLERINAAVTMVTTDSRTVWFSDRTPVLVAIPGAGWFAHNHVTTIVRNRMVKVLDGVTPRYVSAETLGILIDGYTPRVLDDGTVLLPMPGKISVTDKQALDMIAKQMSSDEWGADTCDYVAEVVRATGRTIDDPDDTTDED